MYYMMNPTIISTGILTHVVTNIGASALIAAISAIISTSQNIYAILNKISLSNSQRKDYVYNHIKKLDLNDTIKIMNSMLEEFSKEKKYSKTILLCLESITNIISEIEFELVKLEGMISYNDTLLVFKKVRSYDCSNILQNLTDCKRILDNRRKLLSECLQLDYDVKEENILKEEVQGSSVTLNKIDTYVADNYFTKNIN